MYLETDPTQLKSCRWSLASWSRLSRPLWNSAILLTSLQQITLSALLSPSGMLCLGHFVLNPGGVLLLVQVDNVGPCSVISFHANASEDKVVTCFLISGSRCVTA